MNTRLLLSSLSLSLSSSRHVRLPRRRSPAPPLTCLISSRHVSPDGFPFSVLVTLIGRCFRFWLSFRLRALTRTRFLSRLMMGSHLSTAHVSIRTPRSEHKRWHAIKVGIWKSMELMGRERCEDEEHRMVMLKQKMVSKVLEIGIVFHSVIIGVTVGMS